MARVVVTYALDSAPTAIVATIADHAAEILRKHHDVDVLAIISATRIPFFIAHMLKKYDGIFYFGHGDTDRLYGQLPFGLISPLMIKTDNIKTKIIYAVACLAGKEFAPSIISRGTRAIIANTNYTFVAVPSKERNYFKDFLDIFTTPVKVLANGGTASEAYHALMGKINNYKNLYQANLRVWPNADYYLWALEMNSGFKLFGDPDARL